MTTDATAATRRVAQPRAAQERDDQPARQRVRDPVEGAGAGCPGAAASTTPSRRPAPIAASSGLTPSAPEPAGGDPAPRRAGEDRRQDGDQQPGHERDAERRREPPGVGGGADQRRRQDEPDAHQPGARSRCRGRRGCPAASPPPRPSPGTSTTTRARPARTRGTRPARTPAAPPAIASDDARRAEQRPAADDGHAAPAVDPAVVGQPADDHRRHVHARTRTPAIAGGRPSSTSREVDRAPGLRRRLEDGAQDRRASRSGSRIRQEPPGVPDVDGLVRPRPDPGASATAAGSNRVPATSTATREDHRRRPRGGPRPGRPSRPRTAPTAPAVMLPMLHMPWKPWRIERP